MTRSQAEQSHPGQPEPARSWLAPLNVLAFGSPGYRLHAAGFEAAAIPGNLGGRRFLISGANSGIGFATAQALVERGAQVVLLCRNRVRGSRARARLQALRAGSVELEIVDVSDLEAVARSSHRWAGDAIDGLIHNAGVLPAERTLTRQGLELSFATHIIGPHLMTRLLRGALERSPHSRIVWISSGGMYTRALPSDGWDWGDRTYDGVTAYADGKRAQVVLAELWARELRKQRTAVVSMHPGWVDTPALRHSLPSFFSLDASNPSDPRTGRRHRGVARHGRAGSPPAGRFLLRSRAPAHPLAAGDSGIGVRPAGALGTVRALCLRGRSDTETPERRTRASGAFYAMS